MINLLQPSVGPAELSAVEEVFQANWLGAGARLEHFERRLSGYLACPPSEVLTVSSCSEGLFQAVEALELGAGDEVILPSISFLGAAHAVRAAGARVVLCDVDPRTLNPTVNQVESAITTRTKAILILHYGGYPGDLVAIAELAKRKHLFLIEDAACSLGSFVDDRACGTFGEIGVWSFDAVKLLTTGDGGMIWCSNETLATRIRRNIRLGVGSSGLQRSTSSRWWEIDPTAVGRRATMNDVAAAIGLAQLDKLTGFLRRREEIASIYDAQLSSVPWLVLPPQPPPGAARFYYWIQTSTERRDQLAEYLLGHGVYTNFRYWPLHKTQMYRGCECPGADTAADSTLLLPVHQGLSNADVDHIVGSIRAFSESAL